MPKAILDGARLHGLNAATHYAMERVIDAFASNGVVCRFTCVANGMHSDGSLHYIGNAFDVGLQHIGDHALRDKIVDDIREALDADDPYCDYDIVYGTSGHRNHIHCEWQPKRALNR